ncbi:MAG: acetyl/propionyl/methylcrotonyl-CoA carboxylase subunit alpha [Paracoccaceae bacterium]|nr:acetyl/propionyl/methylcrotonyl-CoA carboxylase subunit alpha [Paracoccaceae bacterium]
MFDRILIANRGEIACRVIKTVRRLGIRSVAVYSDADRHALHVQMADEALNIGPAPSNQSYIDIDRVMDAIARSGADAVHPGYGFLSENRDFALALAAAGVSFIGPPAPAIEAMGDKIAAKQIAMEAGVSTVPGAVGQATDVEAAVAAARSIGYPVMVKASAGGGGKGMRIARNERELQEGFRLAASESLSSFGDDRLFVEKFIESPRHIEIQILADSHGNCVYLNERECSIQRRNQKVVEEAPSPFLDDGTRKVMGQQAVDLARAVDYRSAGTVEFIVDRDRNFYFLEMNTRLQVEHPVTELTTGIDLVEEMIRVAAGERLSVSQADIPIDGWAIECRIYAEDPFRGFLPSVGRLTRYRPPPESDGRLRNDTGVREGDAISIHYDPMIAKLCSRGRDRDEAIALMADALDAFEIEGVGNNLPFLAAVMGNPVFVSGAATTAFIDQEYADGFHGVQLDESVLARLAAATVAMYRVREIRDSRISGRMSHHARNVGSTWVVSLGGRDFPVELNADSEGTTVVFDDGTERRAESDWTPGRRLVEVSVDGKVMRFQAWNTATGFRIHHRGARLTAWIRTPRHHELSRFMIRKAPRDSSNELLCPMPGLVVALHVSEGDDVEEGQALCTVEAMKMENLLRAEKSGRVSKVHVGVGDNLAVDAVIMEFEQNASGAQEASKSAA